MVGENAQVKGTAIARGSQSSRIAMTGGGIEIRREGKPVGSTGLRGGSVYLVIDCSGSMEGQKIVQAKEGSIDFARKALAKRYAVGLISFSSAATHICAPMEDISLVRRHLPDLQADGSTNMSMAIQLATEKLKGKPDPLAMVVITDGMPDNERAALKAAQDAKNRGIDIITVGTDDADLNFLRKLASRDDLAMVVTREELASGITSAANMLPEGVKRP